MSLIQQLTKLYSLDAASIPQLTQTYGKLSLFDWIVCGTGGCEEPVSRKVRDYICRQYADGSCSVFGGNPATAVAASLANGTISHALDYDDTHFAHIGHLSVGVYPAAMAVAEKTDATITELVDAFVIGAEAAINVGMVLGPQHYERGFHQTATAGAFGATVAASRLYELSPGQLHAALGLCSTRASGLKNQFGTMGKPLNAGYAASNGVECAELAALGVTSADDGLDGLQGFIETHSNNPARSNDNDKFLFDDICFKLHACCHGTHAMIEAILDARRNHRFTADKVASLEVCIHPKWLRVCDIKSPVTGLEAKFSYAWLAGMTIKGLSTADPDSYSNKVCTNEALIDFAEKVTVVGANIPDTAAEIKINLKDGVELNAEHDLSNRIDLDTLGKRLRNKAKAVIGDNSDELWEKIQHRGSESVREVGLFE